MITGSEQRCKDALARLTIQANQLDEAAYEMTLLSKRWWEAGPRRFEGAEIEEARDRIAVMVHRLVEMRSIVDSYEAEQNRGDW